MSVKDKNGKEIKQGDIVNVQFKVVNTSDDNQCNLVLVTVLPMPVSKLTTSLSAIHSSQVELVKSGSLQ